MPPDSLNTHEPWLRTAGIIDSAKGRLIYAELEMLLVSITAPTIFLNRLASELSKLSDSLGTLRALVRYLQRHGEQARRLAERPQRLEKLLRALDLGSEVQRWLIEQDVDLLDRERLPDLVEFQREISKSIALATANDLGRSTAARKIILMQRAIIIDIVLAHIYGGESTEKALQRNSVLADTIINWCFDRCFQMLTNKFGAPQTKNRKGADCSVLASQELGGQELNLNSTIHLLMLADCNGRTNAKRSIGNRQFFERLAHDLDDMLNGSEPDHRLYSVRWTQVAGLNQSMVQDYDAAAQYFDNKGRTWERQSLIQLRTVAGSTASGQAFVQSISPWIYRRYIVEADEAGVAVLSRKILRQLSGREYLRWDDSNPTQGVLLIAKTVHLLLLTYGQQSDSLRSLNTFEAIRRLHQHQKLSDVQAKSLIENLQSFDRLVMEQSLDKRPVKEGRFHHRRERSARNFAAMKATLFDILLDEQPKSSWPPEEADLIMDPSPPKAWVAHVLRKYNVDDPQAAYDLLMQMGQEDIFCLSTRQCRHQLAKIAPKLLQVVSATPSPLSTLHNLNRISQSLGGKAVLWQLFSDTPSTMSAMVRLAASSPYLSNHLTYAPGMIDELVDSLLLGRLPLQREIYDTFNKYTNRKSSLESLSEFKRAFVLRIGIRHLLGKSDARDTQTTLAEIPDAMLTQIVKNYWRGNENERGRIDAKAHTPCFAIFAIGRYGSKRLNFRDKLPMLLIYKGNVGESSNDSGLLIQHIYDKLGQSILQQIQAISVGDRMHDAMFNWGPTQGRSQIAMSDRDFQSLFESAGLVEKMATLNLRPIVGDMNFASSFQQSVQRMWSAAGNADLLDLLSEGFNRFRWQSCEDRHNLAFDLRVSEVRELLTVMEASVQAGAVPTDAFTVLDSKLAQLEIAMQLVCKSSTHELKKESDAKRRLAYFINKPDWKAVVKLLDTLEQDTIKCLDGFLAAAERQVRMPVSQMGSHGSSLYTE